MQNAITIDSSVFLSSFFMEEKNNKTSIQFLDLLKKNKTLIIIPMIVYFEVLHNYYRATKNIKETDEISEHFILLNLIKMLKIVSMEAAVLAEFVTDHYQFDIKTSDAIVGLCAMKSKIPLVTWDKKLLDLPSEKLQTFTPKEFLIANKHS